MDPVSGDNIVGGGSGDQQEGVFVPQDVDTLDLTEGQENQQQVLKDQTPNWGNGGVTTCFLLLLGGDRLGSRKSRGEPRGRHK